jgi:hypothetical protein
MTTKPKPGRPRQDHEKRVQVRIPVRLVEEFKEWLRERLDKEVVKKVTVTNRVEK